MMARNLYKNAMGNHFLDWGTVNHPSGWKKNHGVIAASAMAMCAVVLNDAGARRIHWKWNPNTWAEAANEGIEDCFFEGFHLLTRNVPLTSEDGKAGFNEGPNYWTYTLQAFAPAILTSNNMYGTHHPYNWYNDERLLNIAEWYERILLTTGMSPTYDDSRLNTGNNLQALIRPQYDHNSTEGLGHLLPDYIVSICQNRLHGQTQTPRTPESVTRMDESGNFILRNTGVNNSQHYFHLLYEPEEAISKKAFDLGNIEEGTHEHDDMGSFMIAVDNEWLAIDPPYMGWSAAKYINEAEYHNSPFVRKRNGKIDDLKYGEMLHSSDNGCELKMGFTDWTGGYLYDIEGRRAIECRKTGDFIYYVVRDKFTLDNTIYSFYDGVEVHINGNGSIAEQSHLQTLTTDQTTNDNTGRIGKWEHPCTANRTWGLISHTAGLIKGDKEIEVLSYIDNNETVHGSGNNHITNSLGTKPEGGEPYGVHNRIIAKQKAYYTRFQTILIPYRCNQDVLPQITKTETGTDVFTHLEFSTPIDTSETIPGVLKTSNPTVSAKTTDLHYSPDDGGNTVITNPFNVPGSSAILESNARNVFFSRSDFVMERPGPCTESFIAFKQAEITEGTVLKYDDTTYIESTETATIHYRYDSKFRYSGFVQSTQGTTVKLFLPDLQSNYPMKVVDAASEANLSYTHLSGVNDPYKWIEFTVPSGTTRFTIELADPCLADCYFPPTDITIDSSFLFNLGVAKPLGHDLDIVAPQGLLTFTKSSRMNICPDQILTNRDSLVMQETCKPEQRWIVNEDGSRTYLPPDTLPYFCDRDELIRDRSINTTRNMIIVNDRAALVLDSGSVTHIGTNSTILIKPGGTLLIKAGARLIVGDSNCTANRGELLADHGSFVCVEPGALLEFYNPIDTANWAFVDTADRNIIYIAWPKPGRSGAFAGTNTSGGKGQFLPHSTSGSNSPDAPPSRWGNSACLDFCDWNGKNPPYGIKNREWGWSNINMPKAYFVAPDTACKGAYVHVDARKSLNETGFQFTVCRWDTVTQSCSSLRVDSVETAVNCLSAWSAFKADTAGYYKLTLIVRNDCNLTDTFSKIIYVPHDPVAVMTLPETACPGAGTITADGSASTSGLAVNKHRWIVEALEEDSMDINFSESSMEWDIVDAAPSGSFAFPGFTFQGGRRYLIGLAVWGWCKEDVTWDTIRIPLQAEIQLDREPFSYSINPIGPTPIRLKGIVSEGATWSWSPTMGLTQPDSLTTTTIPTEPITYVLTASAGGCTTSDTVTITYNTRAFAGVDRHVCAGSKVVLGTDYNAPLFFGLMTYVAGNLSRDLYQTFRDEDYDQLAAKYFTRYMLTWPYHTEYIDQSDLLAITAFWNNIPEIRQRIMQRPSFADHFEKFVQTEGSISSIRFFVSELTVTDPDSALYELRRYHESQGVDLPSEVSALTEAYCVPFMNVWMRPHEEDSQQVALYWEKKLNDSTWTTMSEWDGHANAVDSIFKNQTYRFTWIDNLNGVVEYDEVTIFADTLEQPQFEVIYQVDSTLYFANTTPGYGTADWNFGDGSSASGNLVSHTFPAIDTTYIVCLTLTNQCGSIQTCDTFRLDSITLYANGFGKKGPYENPESNSVLTQASGNKPSDANQQLNGYDPFVIFPNPATSELFIGSNELNPKEVIRYEIIDMLGKTVTSGALDAHKAVHRLNIDTFQNGLYHVRLHGNNDLLFHSSFVIQK